MIGSLRERATIQRSVESPDGQGGVTRAWADAFTDWVGMEPLGTTTDAQSGRTLRRYRATIRHRTDMPAPARLVWRGQVLIVRSSDDPDLRAQRLHLICEEI